MLRHIHRKDTPRVCRRAPAALVFTQWTQRRRGFQLVWALGLLWYATSAGPSSGVARSAGATIADPGYALDPETGVAISAAIPGHIRVLSGPFNIAGAFTLVFAALVSAYVFMPKRKLLRGRWLPPVVAQVYGATAIVINLLASLPLAATALARGQLHSRVRATLLIALGRREVTTL